MCVADVGPAWSCPEASPHLCPTWPDPGLAVGVPPLPHPHGATEGEAGRTQGFSVGTQVWIRCDLGDGGQCARGSVLGRAPHPTPSPKLGAGRVGQHPGRLSPSSGKEEPLLASDASFPQPVPASSPPPWPLDAQGPGAEQPGAGPGAGTSSVYGGFVRGSLSPPLWRLRWWAGKGSLGRRVRSPGPADPRWGAPTPAARLQDSRPAAERAPGAEVGARPLGYSPTKQRA